MIRIKIVGGLGNQMFQYAAAKALASKYGVSVVADVSAFASYDVHPLKLSELKCDCQFESKEGLLFKILRIPLISRLLLKYSKLFDLYVERDLTFNLKLFDLSKNASLVGYFQSEKYFDFIRDELLEEFQLQNPLSEREENVKEAIIESNSISMHIRRGDYLSNTAANAVHGVCDESYFSNALAYLEGQGELTTDTKLFVFSDDIEWCKENLNFGLYTEFVKPDLDRPEVDIHLMSKCKHNIIANSSFSWWGAWLNKNHSKVVVAPRKWFSNSEKYDSGDIVPERWIRI